MTDDDDQLQPWQRDMLRRSVEAGPEGRLRPRRLVVRLRRRREMVATMVAQLLRNDRATHE